MDWKAWLQAQGFTEDEFNALDEKMQKVLRASHKAAAPPAPAPAPAAPPAPPAPAPANAAGGIFSAIDAEMAEGRRRDAIQTMAVDAVRAAGRTEDVSLRIRALAESALEGAWTTQRFETELLRAQRPQGGFRPTNRDSVVVNQGVLEAAALMSTLHVPGNDLLRSHGEQVVEAADKRFHGTLGLQEMIILAARANGFNGRDRVTDANFMELLAWASPDKRMIQAAGMSTVDLSGILGAVANRALGKVAAEPTWLAPKICGVANHTNFHSHNIYTLSMNGEMEQVGPTGELKSLDLSQETYTRQVKTRGAVLRLSREHIINDDLGAFTRNAQGLARKSYTTREKALFTLINATAAGASFFTAARGNYITGSAFGNDGMAAAVKAFRNLKDAAGEPIMVDPAIVLVPSSLEDVAGRTLKAGSGMIATVLLDEASPRLESNANNYAGRFGGIPHVSPWMENSNLTGYSALAWLLLADPDIYPAFEVSYLNGNQTPTVNFFGLEAQADQLGMTWRVFWDFGVDTAEWRAGVKSAGA